jgi:hypothetical protein
MRMSGFVNLAAQAERKPIPHATELVIQLVAVHPLPVHGVAVGNRKLEILRRESRGRDPEHVNQMGEVSIHGYLL